MQSHLKSAREHKQWKGLTSKKQSGKQTFQADQISSSLIVLPAMTFKALMSFKLNYTKAIFMSDDLIKVLQGTVVSLIILNMQGQTNAAIESR